MIGYDEERQLFHLKTEKFSYLMQVSEDGSLIHRYFGKRVEHYGLGHNPPKLDRSFSPGPFAKERTFSLDTLSLEYSSNGLGDFRTSAIELRSEAGVNLALKYQDHRQYRGKPRLPGLPSSYGNQEEVESLEIDLRDDCQDVTVTLFYYLFERANMLVRSVRVRAGARAVKLQKCLSLMLDLPARDFKIHSLTGRYAYEKERTLTKLQQGSYRISSVRGASGHAQTPFLALAAPDAGEDRGEVYSSHLVYSGNFQAFAEVGPLKTLRLGLGINDTGFAWHLAPHEEFYSPEAWISYTDAGFADMSQTSHRFIKEHLVRGTFQQELRPILLNNWEATYFDFSEEKLLALADKAREVGIELFVLDDGWFGERNSDTCSLGDWQVNSKKLPGGLKGLADELHQRGLKFGLWVEPEMISEDSDLYRQHPDWAVRAEGYAHTYSREQLVLDLSKAEVCDYLIDTLTELFKSARIDYVKWDMNRNITNIPAQFSNHEREEFHHRYMLGLYRILESLYQTFPHILFESCSGGGGRYDLGMLHYMPQTWTSDDTDAIARLSIQEGTSLIYPLITMGAHVSAVPNHQVGRITPLRTRGHVGMLGNLGYELDLTALGPKDLEEIAQQIKTYKEIRSTVQFGTFHRLETRSNNEHAYLILDEQQAVLTYIKTLAQPEAPLSQVRLKGLDPHALYTCEALGSSYYGDELMNIGLTLPYVQEDFYSLQYIFTKKGEKR